METPPPIADVVAPDPSSVRIAAIRAATTGVQFLNAYLHCQQEGTANPRDTLSTVSSK